MFRTIRNASDSHLLQLDLDSVSNWCVKNNLQLNIKKCQTFSLYRGNNLLNYTYDINSINLNRVITMKDLGLVLDRKLNFMSHIDFITSKAYGMLGFIKRNSALKILIQ